MDLHGRIPNHGTPMPSPSDSATRRRYAIWELQSAAGHTPCFGTSQRLICLQRHCPYRRECLRLKASWRR